MDIIPVDMKRCAACGAIKAEDAFRWRSKAKQIRYYYCRSCESAKQKAAYYQDLDKTHEARRRYAQTYRSTPHGQEKARAWRVANAEHLLSYSREYGQQNKPVRAAREAKRRAKKVNGSGSFTAAEFLEKVKQCKGHCHWCHEKIQGTPHADHVIALARGGTNSIENIVPSCASCNSRKWALTPWEFNGRLF